MPASDRFSLGDDVRDELERAFRSLRPELADMARDHARLDPDALVGQLGDDVLDQFLNAYEVVFHEALQGAGRDARDLVLDSAVEPILGMGQSALGLIRSNVLWGVLLTDRLLALVRDDVRRQAAMWLASFLSEYAHDLGERALPLERKGR